MARSSNRTGYGNNRGALNPKYTISGTAPTRPKKNDIWLDTNILTQLYYNGSLWIPFGDSIFPWESGEALYQGESLYVNQSDGKIYKTPTSGDMAIGIAYADCTSGDDVLIVTNGIAYVLPESLLSLSKGYVISTSTSEAGRVRNDSAVPSSTQHFREHGHVLEDSPSAGALTRCVLHFN